MATYLHCIQCLFFVSPVNEITGHSLNQPRPLGVETGQYPSLGSMKKPRRRQAQRGFSLWVGRAAENGAGAILVKSVKQPFLGTVCFGTNPAEQASILGLRAEENLPPGWRLRRSRGAGAVCGPYCVVDRSQRTGGLAADGSSQAIWCGPVPPVRFYGFVG
jgi:hypothetical protein